MAIQGSYCSGLLVKKCDNLTLDISEGSLSYSPSINVNASVLQYKYTPELADNMGTGSHSLSVCYPHPTIRACAGVTINENSVVPFASIGINAGSVRGQYKHNLIDSDKCTTTITNGLIENGNIIKGTLTTVCPDSKTIIQFSNPSELTIDRIENVLNKLNNKLDQTQKKIERVMEIKGVKWQSIGVSSGEMIGCEQSPIINSVQLINNIITNLRTVNPNATIFDVLKKMKENNVNIPNDNLPKKGKWYRIDGKLYPDCCEYAFQSGYYIDYHIREQIDSCRLCGTPFRLEYFI